MSAPPPDRRDGLSRSQVTGLALIADVIGALVIVAALPLAWSLRLVLLAVFLGATQYASRAYLRRRGAS